MWNYSTILIIISIQILGCNPIPVHQGLCYEQNSNHSSFISLPIDSSRISQIIIPTDSIYYKYFDYARVDGKSYLILINEIKRSIEIYNLESQIRIFSKNLEKYKIKYPHAGFVNGIDFVDFNRIYLASENIVWNIDTFSIKNTFDLPYVKHSGEKLKLYNLDHSPLRFDSCTNLLLFQSYAVTLPVHSKSFYRMPVTIGVDINDRGIVKYPVSYPSIYQQKYFGFANMVFRNVVDCMSYYSFPADPQVYCFNHKTQTIKSFCAKSNLDNGEDSLAELTKRSHAEQKLSMMIQMPFYLSFIPDPTRNQFFRFFLTPLSETKASGDYNTWQDKELILMIYNSDYACIEEFSLGINTYSYHRSFVGEEGLYLAVHDEKIGGSNLLQFDIFR